MPVLIGKLVCVRARFEASLRLNDGQIMFIKKSNSVLTDKIRYVIIALQISDINYTDVKDLSKVALNDSLEDYYSQNVFRQILRIDLEEKSKENVISVVKQLQATEGIVYASPDYIFETESLSPNDPYYTNGSQWGLNGTYGIDIEEAWDITTGSQEVTVGVIDTGISFHEDLYTKFSVGYDFYNGNNLTTDDESSHGTHVTGIIAATSNQKGIVGTAPNIKLSALQTSYWDEEEEKYLNSISDVLAAIGFASGMWGTTYQISILNHSIAGFGTSTSMLYSISQFPGLFVWSAGNGVKGPDNIYHGVNVDEYSNINSFALDNLISVGAIDRYGRKAEFSNYGNNVDIYAPGVSIWSCVPNNSYATKQGASMAAPFVSGVAALILSDNPGLTAAQVKDAIIEGAKSITITGNNNVKYSSLRLSAAGALECAREYSVIPAPLRLSVAGKNNGVWSIRLRNPNNFAVYAAYNSKMCFENDAKTFSGLSDIVDITINAKTTKTVSISENALAGWITASIGYSHNNQHYRLITCAHGLSEGSATFSYYVVHNTVSVLNYPEVSSPPSYLDISITANKTGKQWTVKFINDNSYDVNIEYNSKLCFSGDAKSFSGLKDIVSTTIPANLSKTVKISTNALADYIAVKINYYYHGFAYSRVTYAKAEVSPTCYNNQIRYL